MTAPAQLALLTDPRRDDLTPAEVFSVEARVEDDDHRRSAHAWPAPRCRCARPIFGMSVRSSLLASMRSMSIFSSAALPSVDSHT